MSELSEPREASKTLFWCNCEVNCLSEKLCGHQERSFNHRHSNKLGRQPADCIKSKSTMTLNTGGMHYTYCVCLDIDRGAGGGGGGGG